MATFNGTHSGWIPNVNFDGFALEDRIVVLDTKERGTIKGFRKNTGHLEILMDSNKTLLFYPRFVVKESEYKSE